MERLEALKGYYETHDENARLESRHGSVEFLTTVRYVEKYLRPGMRILEIGAGTGRYSHYFARQGYTVDAIELTECNIDVFKANTEPGENVTIRQGDAINLEGIESDAYDITLLLGPMYHLYNDADKHAALSEALRVTKKGGIVFAAYCNNDTTVYHFCFRRGEILNVINNNLLDLETFECSSTAAEIIELSRKEDIDALMEKYPVTRLHYVGTDMLTHFIGETVDQMSDEVFDLYMKFHFVICERADMIGATSHMLDIFRKDV